MFFPTHFILVSQKQEVLRTIFSDKENAVNYECVENDRLTRGSNSLWGFQKIENFNTSIWEISASEVCRTTWYGRSGNDHEIGKPHVDWISGILILTAWATSELRILVVIHVVAHRYDISLGRDSYLSSSRKGSSVFFCQRCLTRSSTSLIAASVSSNSGIAI